MNRGYTIAVVVLVMVLVAGGSFYGGMLFGKSQAQPQFTRVMGTPGAFGHAQMAEGVPGGQSGSAGGPSGGGQGGMVVGEIETVSDGRMTVTDNSGQTIEVSVTDTTLIQKQASVTLADLHEGETVMISGSRSDDGSITARSVQVMGSSEFLLRPGGPGEPPTGTVTP